MHLNSLVVVIMKMNGCHHRIVARLVKILVELINNRVLTNCKLNK